MLILGAIPFPILVFFPNRKSTTQHKTSESLLEVGFQIAKEFHRQQDAQVCRAILFLLLYHNLQTLCYFLALYFPPLAISLIT